MVKRHKQLYSIATTLFFIAFSFILRLLAKQWAENLAWTKDNGKNSNFQNGIYEQFLVCVRIVFWHMRLPLFCVCVCVSYPISVLCFHSLSLSLWFTPVFLRYFVTFNFVDEKSAHVLKWFLMSTERFVMYLHDRIRMWERKIVGMFQS